MRRLRQCAINSLAIFAIALIFASCTSTKDVPYFKDVSDSTKLKTFIDAPYHDPLIIPDDILSVTVTTIDPTTTAPVNQSAQVPSSAPGASLLNPSPSGSSQTVPGIVQVDKDGNISIPILGTIKVAGMSTSDAKTVILKLAEKYFKEPDVQIRFVNFTITVMGEVQRPATFTVPSEKISILDALGMAGDLTIYGRRDNVLLIRENNGVKELARLNLNNTDILKSPYFYLRQNDVVYVEPNKQKVIAADAARTRTLTVAGAFAAVLIVLITRIK
jgi:polysaccharide export outer membrane protein